jgi:hypothetical protein
VNLPSRAVGGQLSASGGLWLVKRSACARAALPDRSPRRRFDWPSELLCDAEPHVQIEIRDCL